MRSVAGGVLSGQGVEGASVRATSAGVDFWGGIGAAGRRIGALGTIFLLDLSDTILDSAIDPN